MQLSEQVHLPLRQVKVLKGLMEQQVVSVKEPSQSQSSPSLGQKPCPCPPRVLQGHFSMHPQVPALHSNLQHPAEEDIIRNKQL